LDLLKPYAEIGTEKLNDMVEIEGILFHNYLIFDRNHDPMCFEYPLRAIFPQFVFHKSGRETNYECIDDGMDECFCIMNNGNKFPYSQSELLLKGRLLFLNCGPFYLILV
jgi:hypothetical protein